jgi:hypothetical protein
MVTKMGILLRELLCATLCNSVVKLFFIDLNQKE